jgi:hypothetical protein
VGKGSLTYAEGDLYIQSEDNLVALAGAGPGGYKEKGRFRIADQGLPSWAHPVVAGGRLYLRNQATLAAYDVRARRRPLDAALKAGFSEGSWAGNSSRSGDR